jgi:hypothetical protein
LQQTFRYVYLAPTSKSWRENSRSTFVIIAGDSALDLTSIETIDAGDGKPLLARRILNENELNAVLAAGQVVLLTDQYAPVDQMLAPVVRGERP